MVIIKIILIFFIVIGILGYLASWVHAYHRVENLEKWKQQMAALQPWWFLDKNLLKKEFDYIRKKAIIYLIVYLVPFIILWYIKD